MKDACIVGLDVGSTAIRMVVGQPHAEAGERKLQVISATEVASEGIAKGVITSIDDAAHAISSCLEKAERMSGTPIDSACVGISGVHINPQSSRGIVAVGKVNGEISRQDLDRAIEAARAIATPANYEILHVIPRQSIIDGQISTKDPVGMTGTRLEVDTLIIQGFASEVRNFTKCIYKTGLEIDDLVFSILASAEGTLTTKQKELGVSLVNIGGTTTSIIIFEEGEIIHMAVLPFGSDHITNDIAIGLRISIEAAEKIKLDYGTLYTKDLDRKAEIDLSEIEEGEQGNFSLKIVGQIIEARVEEIFDKIELELKKIGRSGILPAGIILTGGGSKLAGMIDMAKRRLRLPASYASMKNLVNPLEKLFDQSFTTAAGLALWSLNYHAKQRQTTNFIFNLESTSDVRGRVKKWIRALLP